MNGARLPLAIWANHLNGIDMTYYNKMKSFVFLILLLCSLSLTAQQTWKVSGLKTSVGYQGESPYLEFGLIKTRVSNHIYSGTLTSELNYHTTERNLYVGPKVGAEFYFVPGPFGPGVKLAVADYTNFKIHSFYVIPEAVVHVIGILGLGYGYNIRLSGENKLDFRPTHKVNMFLNIEKRS